MSKDYEKELLSAMAQKGLFPEKIIFDGCIHRFATEDKPGKKNGWYVAYQDDPVSAAYGNWKTGEKYTYCSKKFKDMSFTEKELMKKRTKKNKERFKMEKEDQYAKAKEIAIGVLKDCSQVKNGHEYLKAKNVKPLGPIVLSNDGSLVLPIYDAEGAVTSLQFIGPDGSKNFLAGGKVKGGYYPILALDGSKERVLYICEGYATGASIHEVTEESVLVAFNCGNLLSVAEMARNKYPKRKIVICADNDHENKVNSGMIAAKEAALKINALLAVPTFIEGIGKSDFNDLAQSEGSEAVLKCLISAAPIEQASQIGDINELDLVAVDLDQLLSKDIPPREYVLRPVIPTQGLAMVYAYRGVGKTYFALSVAYAVASGQPIFKWKVDVPRRVLYIDGEMPIKAMQERLASIVKNYPGGLPSSDYLRIVTPDLQTKFMPNLSTIEGQNAIEPFLKDVELVVIDNLATLSQIGRENETESWRPIQKWLLSLRQRGISVLLVHHAGKAGDQRGTSAREDILDTVIKLSRPGDYREEEGARFEVALTKARGIAGEEAKTFEAQLVQNDSGLSWVCRDIENVELEKIIKLQKEGYSLREIEEETGISKSRAQRMLKQIK